MGKNELWKNIWGFTGYYQVSNMGRVRGVERLVKHKSGRRMAPARLLKPGKNEFGYVIVLLSKQNKAKCMRVSRLVAKAFIPNPLNLPEVNHKKGNKGDNRATQLEWCTISANKKHAWYFGLNKGNTRKRFLG